MKKIAFLFIAVLYLSILPYSCDNKLQKEYEKAISNADTLFNQEDYSDAEINYAKALKLKPEENYPAQRINEIKVIMEQKMVDDNYSEELGIAESLFNGQNYNEAKHAFIRANKIKPDEQYPIDMINKIQELQLKIEQEEEEKNNPYFMIVGSFEVESNAINLQSQLISLGYDSKILVGVQGFKRVTFSSYPDIHAAYNKLPDAFAEGYNDAWIYREIN